MSSISQFPIYSSRSVSPCPQAEQPKPRQVWTPEEDRLLAEAVAKETPANGSINWCKVASHLSRRNNKDCRKRWHYNVAHNIRKGTWTREEDQRLREAFDIYGARWSKVAQIVGSRNGDQCWKRWYDCLDPKIDRSPWTPEEDILLLQIVSQQGRNWTEIVNTHFPNRTSLAAKNRYSILRRRQESACGGGASPAPSSRSRSSTPACRGPSMGNSRSRATTLSATATPSPILVTTPQYLSPTPPTSNQLTPELVASQCFTPSPLSLSDTGMESTSCSSSGFGGVGLGLILPPSAMSMATPSSTFTTDATTISTSFDMLPFSNNFSQDCGAWNSYAPEMMVSAGSLTATSLAYNTPDASPSPSVVSAASPSSSSFSPSSSLSSSSPPPPSLSLNGIYMPIIAGHYDHNGLSHFNNYNPQMTTQTQQQQQQQQQFEFIVQAPTPTGTGASPMCYSSW